MTTELWPFVLYAGAVVLVVAGMLLVSFFLGERHKEPATGEPYESGILSTGSSRLRFPSGFYLMAIFFLIFDLESVFLYAWAVAARELGWRGFFEMLAFVGILLIALAYLWGTGVLQGRMDAQPGMKKRV
jgi:NADH-quinone oxidoreductase subunit A